ncbi:MAG: hypothetical protein DA405_04910 [Bacteroidetes bacterium]|nr:MAG: hypothetical protein DA405_04910 [Bacteroidota bacterium]
MKTVFKLSLLILAISLTSCSKDRDNDTSGSQNLTGLAAFLNGEFNVTRTDYNGSLTTVIATIPLNGTGTGTQGFYNFNANAKTVSYSVQTTMQASVLGQNIDFPVNVGGNGTIQYVSDTRFTISDPNNGTTTYDVSNQSSTGLRATTRFETDTLGGTVDLLLDVYLEKK